MKQLSDKFIVPYFTGSKLSFIGYLIVCTVQLGATVDYAILLTHNYLSNRKKMEAKRAMKVTIGESVNSLLVSAIILSGAGFCLGITSSNPIVAELGVLLGRGTILSLSLVLCFLPVVLVLMDKVIEKTTFRVDFYKGGI